jgi:hypothetical protein
LKVFFPSNIDKYDEDLVKAAMVYFENWSGQKIDIKSEISIWNAK